MAEISRPWSGTVTGDSGPYSDDQWTDVWKALLGPVIASEGVFQDQLNDLVLGGLPATPVTINTGRALVNGIWYESDASVSIAIPTPAANPRVDRIVLRADWALQTVRLTRIAGAEGAAPTPPAITQNDGVTWDLPLWQVFVTVGAVISTWRDERRFIGQYVPVGVTLERVYLEEDFFLPKTGNVTGDLINSFVVVIVANGLVNTFSSATFGGGGATLRFSAANATNRALFTTLAGRPDVIDAQTLIRCKQPTSDAEVDRAIGYVSAQGDLTPTNGVFFRSDGAANWFAVTRSGGVETITDTGQALDDTFRAFEIRQTGTDLVTFLIDGVVVATHQDDIPAASLALLAEIFDSGAGTAGANDYMDVDLIRMTGDR